MVALALQWGKVSHYAIALFQSRLKISIALLGLFARLSACAMICMFKKELSSGLCWQRHYSLLPWIHVLPLCTTTYAPRIMHHDSCTTTHAPGPLHTPGHQVCTCRTCHCCLVTLAMSLHCHISRQDWRGSSICLTHICQPWYHFPDLYNRFAF